MNKMTNIDLCPTEVRPDDAQRLLKGVEIVLGQRQVIEDGWMRGND